MKKVDGGGKRFNKGKLQLHLVPLEIIVGMAKVLMYGASKYDKDNWKRGMSWSTCFDCAQRHLFKWWYCREEYDDESGCHHLAHVACNIAFLMYYIIFYPKGDDRPALSEKEKTLLLNEMIYGESNEK